MNSLTRAIAGKLRSSSRKCLLFLPPPPQQQLQSQHLIPLLQNHSSSLYSTTTRRTSTITPNPSRFKRNPKPQQQQQHSSPLSSTQVPNIEIEKGLNQEEQVSKITDWARPSEIPWQAKVANSVNLIGHVQIPVQFEASPDGKYWAGTIISQRDGDSSDSPPFWIPIIFEGDLAHIAACHLKEKDFVYIDGQLSADPPPFTMSQGQANVQVMVRSINFVQWSSQKKIAFAPHKLEKLDNNGTASMKDEVSVNQLWKDLFAKPHEWWDIRLKKGNSTAAAFENKDNGQLLWINESTPEWIQKKLECLTFDPKISPKSHKSGAFMDAISGMTFDYVASGHYANIVHSFTDQMDKPSILKLSNDMVKDQTYFLSHLSQSQLKRLIFPLGCIPKDKVRYLAKKFDLPNKDRKDSQGICFLGKIKFSEFVARHIGEMEGVILEAETGDFLGKHRGFWFYTIGQRQGLRLSGGPWSIGQLVP